MHATVTVYFNDMPVLQSYLYEDFIANLEDSFNTHSLATVWKYGLQDNVSKKENKNENK